MVSVPLFWGIDVTDRKVCVFAYKDGATFGLDQDSFTVLQALTGHVMETAWVHRRLSRAFVETCDRVAPKPFRH